MLSGACGGTVEPGDFTTKCGSVERYVLICSTPSTTATFTPPPVDSDTGP